jgi:hypothetical protein
MNKKTTFGDKIFDWCVFLLQYLAIRTHLTYKQINVIIFVLLWPVITIGLIILFLIKK